MAERKLPCANSPNASGTAAGPPDSAQRHNWHARCIALGKPGREVHGSEAGRKRSPPGTRTNSERGIEAVVLKGPMLDAGKLSIVPETLHHVELQIVDISAAIRSFGWLLTELGYEQRQAWNGGRSWILGRTYAVLARAPNDGAHDRRKSGLSHLAFHAGTAADVNTIWTAAPDLGWKHFYADRHPWARGEGHYAASVESGERFKVESVATTD